MINKCSYQGICWWCGKKADSAEHKYKKTDLIREFGKGPYKKHEAITRVIQGNIRKIPGPNSNEAKFPQILCQNCNSNESQPFDRAYDLFLDYIRNNEHQILERKGFISSDIFGSSWIVQKENLVRYYVKHIACRLAEANVLIRNEIIDFLNGKPLLKFIRIKLEIREDMAAYQKEARKDGFQDGSLAIGKLMYMHSKSTGAMSEANSFIEYRWLRLNYIYDENIDQYEDNFSNDLVSLPSDYDVHPELVPLMMSQGLGYIVFALKIK